MLHKWYLRSQILNKWSQYWVLSDPQLQKCTCNNTVVINPKTKCIKSLCWIYFHTGLILLSVFNLYIIISIKTINSDNFIDSILLCPNATFKTYCTCSFSKVHWCNIHAMHNLPELFCHLSFYLMPTSHESSHYRFQSNLFPLWTAAVYIKKKWKNLIAVQLPI